MRNRPAVSFRRANLRKPKPESPECKEEPQNTPLPLSVSLGDCESEKDQVLLQYLGWDVFASLSRFEREVLYDCKFFFFIRTHRTRELADTSKLLIGEL